MPVIVDGKEADMANKEADMALERVQYIRYLIHFKKYEVQILFNSGSEVNAMTLAFAAKLGLKMYHINVEAQKIDSFTF